MFVIGGVVVIATLECIRIISVYIFGSKLSKNDIVASFAIIKSIYIDVVGNTRIVSLIYGAGVLILLSGASFDDSQKRVIFAFYTILITIIMEIVIVRNIKYNIQTRISTVPIAFVVMMYVLSVVIMSPILFSGDNNELGILYKRWYGLLFVLFPATTALFALIVYNKMLQRSDITEKFNGES